MKLLIVEDEPRIAQLIRKLVHFEKLQLSCMGIAENGQRALEMIRHERPDIVITDIRMPKISGLDLIEITRRQYPEIRFIVLSGYKEFEYAHRALQYEVDGYLLKPLNETELNETLQRVVSSLDEKHKEAFEKEKIRQEVNRSRQIIRRDYLRAIMEQGEEDALSSDLEIPLELNGDVFRGIDIKLDNPQPEEISRKEAKIISDRVLDIVEGQLREHAEEVLCSVKEAFHIYGLFNYHSEHTREIRTAISNILSQIKDYLLRFEQYEVTIGIGMEKQQFAQTRLSIREAIRSSGNRIHLGCGRLIYADILKEMTPYKSPVRAVQEDLLSLMEGHSSREASRMVKRIFDEYTHAENVDYSGCYEIAFELNEFLYNWLESEAEELGKNRKNCWIRCQNITQVETLRDYMAQEYAQALTMMKEAAESESVKPVRIAKTYIEEHYGEKVVLEDVAALAGLNPVYFSVLFKKETDMNFSSYLRQVRMDKARELLRTTNETIAAIGDRVGYKDSRHFSQTFTKVVGVKPALYRRLHS